MLRLTMGSRKIIWTGLFMYVSSRAPNPTSFSSLLACSAQFCVSSLNFAAFRCRSISEQLSGIAKNAKIPNIADVKSTTQAVYRHPSNLSSTIHAPAIGPRTGPKKIQTIYKPTTLLLGTGARKSTTMAAGMTSVALPHAPARNRNTKTVSGLVATATGS